MKREEDPRSQGGAEFSDRLRGQLRRSVDAARQLIGRMRSLLGDDERAATAGRAGSVGTPAESAPRVGADDAWMPEARGDRDRQEPVPPAAPMPPAPRFRDEEGQENELPTEFATATMGHILLSQGRIDEARRVFETVLVASPDDPEARRGLALLAPPLPPPPAVPSGPPPPAPEPFGLLDRVPPPWGYNVSEAHALPVDPGTLVAYWELTEEALSQAGQAIGLGALRSLCVVSLRPGTRGLERVERYIDDVNQVGDWFVTGLPAGATHHAAVGLRRGGRFVPIVHAAPVATPRGRPSPAAARVRATVVIPPRQEGLPWLRALSRILRLVGPADALSEVMPRLSRRPGVTTETTSGSDEDQVFERAWAEWQAAHLGWSGSLPHSNQA